MIIAAFIMCLGYFTGDKRIMAAGAVVLVAWYAILPEVDVLGALGFDGEAIQGAMGGDQD